MILNWGGNLPPLTLGEMRMLLEVICTTKNDLGYDQNNTQWVLISEKHEDFPKLKSMGYHVRYADDLEMALFNSSDELDENDFKTCGHPTHFPGPMDRGHFDYICAKCGHKTLVRSGI